MTKNEHTVRIQENYKDYSPPFPARKSIERMLDHVPQVHLSGLKDIVLTNAEAMNHSRRRKKTWSRKRKVGLSQAGGLYHQEWKGQPAWIEIFQDNIFNDQPWLLTKLPIFRDMMLAVVLYHEVGHHIHRTQFKEHREREDVADDWQKKLSRSFLRKKYWYLRVILFPITVWPYLFRLTQKVVAKVL